MTLLSVTVAVGNLKILELLIDKGADVNATDEHGSTLLFDAFCDGHLEVIDFLIKQGVNINAKNIKGDTLLHLAVRCMSTNQKLIPLLIQKGADINAKNIKGDTPLHNAVRVGNFEALDSFYFRSNSCDCYADLWHDYVNTPNDQGQTPLHLAAQRDNKEMCLWLLTHEAKLNVKDKQGFTPFDYVFLRPNKNLAGQLLYNHFARENCSLAFFFNHKICKECFNKLSKDPHFNLSLNPNPNPNLINTLCPSCQEQFENAKEVELCEQEEKQLKELAPILLAKFGFPEYNQYDILESFTSLLKRSLCQSCRFKMLNNFSKCYIPRPCKSCKEKLNECIQELKCKVKTSAKLNT